MSTTPNSVKVINIGNEKPELNDFLTSRVKEEETKVINKDYEDFEVEDDDDISDEEEEKHDISGGDEDDDDDDEDDDDDDDEDEDEDEDAQYGGKKVRFTYDDDEETASEASSRSTIKMLSEDPLFIVLSEYFVNKKGKNIVDVLEEINISLKRLAFKNKKRI